MPQVARSSSRRTVLIIGHQNSGKTTLFNRLTGSRSKTVNYPGSTVSCQVGRCLTDSSVVLVDTPGIRSLNGASDDERLAISSLYDLSTIQPSFSGVADGLILVIDQSQLARQLVLYFQLIEAGFKPMIVLTMGDIALKEGRDVSVTALSGRVSTPVVKVSTRTGTGVSDVMELVRVVMSSTPAYDPNASVPSPTPIESMYSAARLLARSVTTVQPVQTRFNFDRWMLHPVWGLFIFAGCMTVFFASIFSWVAPIMDGIDWGFSRWIDLIHASFPHSFLASFLADGLLQSAASFLVFVPQILVLFMLIGLMEQSGFLARGAALMDKPLSYIGLNGRSFVPLLSGFSCAIPAMMAARTIPNRKERLLTLCLIPLMQCSARLPVFGLLVGLLAPQQPLLGGLIMTAIYFLSLVIAAVVSLVISRFLTQPGSDDGFHLELPRWRVPIFRDVGLTAWHQTTQFIRRAGPIIFCVGIGLWILTHFPTPEASYALTFGHWLTPIWAPMGIDWRVGVAILLSFAAREVFVSALALMVPGGVSFSVGVSLGLIVFFMVSMQCMSTVAVAKNEMGGWKWPILMSVAYIGLAYGLAVACVHLVG